MTEQVACDGGEFRSESRTVAFFASFTLETSNCRCSKAAAMPVNNRWIPSKKRRVLDRGGGLASNPAALFGNGQAVEDDDGGDGDGDALAGPSSLAIPSRPPLFRLV